MAPEQPISELSDEQTYEVEFESNKYQVEVQLLKNTATYVHAGAWLWTTAVFGGLCIRRPPASFAKKTAQSLETRSARRGILTSGCRRIIFILTTRF
jgi:hypothetical protein